MSTSGTKMSDYTPLANNEKEYFMGDGQGAVVTVGKVEQGGDNVNRLVKLRDLAQGGGGGGYTAYNVTKTVSDLTPYEESEQTVYALDINVSNHGIYFLDIQTIDGSADLKTIRAHIPTLTAGDYYDIVIQTQVNDSWAPTYKWKVFVDNGAGGETEMTKIWYHDDYRDEFTTDTELHVFGRHATIMRLEGGAGE
jgi:hypothetical protein